MFTLLLNPAQNRNSNPARYGEWNCMDGFRRFGDIVSQIRLQQHVHDPTMRS